MQNKYSMEDDECLYTINEDYAKLQNKDYAKLQNEDYAKLQYSYMQINQGENDFNSYSVINKKRIEKKQIEGCSLSQVHIDKINKIKFTCSETFNEKCKKKNSMNAKLEIEKCFELFKKNLIGNVLRTKGLRKHLADLNTYEIHKIAFQIALHSGIFDVYIPQKHKNKNTHHKKSLKNAYNGDLGDEMKNIVNKYYQVDTNNSNYIHTLIWSSTLQKYVLLSKISLKPYGSMWYVCGKYNIGKYTLSDVDKQIQTYTEEWALYNSPENNTLGKIFK